MQNKLTDERLQQMEKELCDEQVATNDKYNECFQLLGAARRGLQMDQVNTERLVPRYPDADTFPEMPKTVSGSDYRIVARGLLEDVLGTMEKIYSRPVQAIQSNQTSDDLRFGIAQLKVALAIEKPELSAAAVPEKKSIWSCNFCFETAREFRDIKHSPTCPHK